MSWPKESYRHSLSSQGVRTKTAIRMAHSKRPVSERMQDERQLDILVTDARLWLSSPQRYDYPNIDTPNPIKIVDTITRKGKRTTSHRIVGELDNQTMGEAEYVERKKDIHFHILMVAEEHEGKGYASYLMREFINQQDKMQKPASLYVFPTMHHYELPKKEWEKRRRILKKFYSTFGFIEHPDDKWVMVRKPVIQ